MSEQPFGFGDLVKVTGYHPRVFKVDGYHTDIWHYPNETWTETVYELIDAYTGDWIEAEAEDLMLVVSADKAEEYLKTNDMPNIETDESPNYKFLGFGIIPTEGIPLAKKEPKKLSARELSAKEAEERKAARKAKAEEIDNLLDRRNWYAEQFAKSGNVEDNERVLAIDQELKKLAEK
jgi:hypothetical protein